MVYEGLQGLVLHCKCFTWDCLFSSCAYCSLFAATGSSWNKSWEILCSTFIPKAKLEDHNGLSVLKICSVAALPSHLAIFWSRYWIWKEDSLQDCRGQETSIRTKKCFKKAVSSAIFYYAQWDKLWNWALQNITAYDSILFPMTIFASSDFAFYFSSVTLVYI